MKTKIAMVLGGLLAGFLVAEVALRVFAPLSSWRIYDTAGPIESARWQGHPFLPYIGKASSRFEIRNGPTGELELIETNAYGFRSHEFPTEKGPDDFYVLCFGGSTTYGYRVAANAQTWPEVLQAKLAARYPEKNVQVFNMGLDMATTTMSVVTLALIGVHVQPDLVVVYHGYNDLDALGAANYRTDHAHFYKDLDVETAWKGTQVRLPRWMRGSYALHYLTGAMDRRLRLNDLGAEVSLPREQDADELRGIDAMLKNLRTMRSMARGRGGEAIFSTFQFTEGDIPRYRQLNDALREYFSENDYLWVDQEALIPDRDPSINVDDCHFTQKGRDLMAKNFFDFIVKNDLVRRR